MRKSAKIITALSVAGLAVAAGSAFTASNDFTAVSLVSGYGQVVATGATITAVSDTTLSTDNSRLDHVTFTSSTNVSGKTVSMTLKNGTTVVGSPYTSTSLACTLGTYTAGSMTITCNTADNPLLNTFDTTGLTVVS